MPFKTMQLCQSQAVWMWSCVLGDVAVTVAYANLFPFLRFLEFSVTSVPMTCDSLGKAQLVKNQVEDRLKNLSWKSWTEFPTSKHHQSIHE